MARIDDASELTEGTHGWIPPLVSDEIDAEFIAWFKPPYCVVRGGAWLRTKDMTAIEWDTPIFDCWEDAILYTLEHEMNDAMQCANESMQMVERCKTAYRCLTDAMRPKPTAASVAVEVAFVAPLVRDDDQCRLAKVDGIWMDVPGEFVGRPINYYPGYEFRKKPVHYACPECYRDTFLVLSHDEKHFSCSLPDCGGWGSLEQCAKAFEDIPF